MEHGPVVRAILDANVIYPPFLRDVLLRLAVADFYRPHWTRRIHEEWMRNVSADRPDLSPANLDRIRDRMDASFPGALVSGFAGLEALFNGVAPEDRHVAAAALRAGAQRIITANLKDFPADALQPHSIEAVHPDQFIMDLALDNVWTVRRVLEEHRIGLLRPPLTTEEYAEAFIRAGLTRTAALLWP